MLRSGGDLTTIKTFFFALLPLIGLIRLFSKWRERKREEIPLGKALTDEWIRAEVKRGNRPRAMRGWRDLHKGTLADARVAIDAIEAEIRPK